MTVVSSIPKKAKKISVDRERIFLFDSTIRLKDFCPKKIKKLVPELSSVIDELISLVPNRKYITVDVMKHNFKTKSKTCRDVSFHVDGINNDYALWCVGSFRTEFLMNNLSVQGIGTLAPKDLADEIKKCVEKESDLTLIEAEDSVPMLYDSRCIHRGRVAEQGSKRILVRICSSDYISPKNVNLNKLRL